MQLALDATVEDSQKDSPLSLDVLRSKKAWVRDEKTVRICNRLLKQFNLPDFDQKFRFTSEYEIELI